MHRTLAYVACGLCLASGLVIAQSATASDAEQAVAAESQSSIELRGQLGEHLNVRLSYQDASKGENAANTTMKLHGSIIDQGPQAALTIQLTASDFATTADQWNIQAIDKTLMARLDGTNTIIVGRSKSEGERVIVELESLGSGRTFNVSLDRSAEKLVSRMAEGQSLDRFGMMLGLTLIESFEAPNGGDRGQGSGNQVTFKECLETSLEICEQDCDNNPQTEEQPCLKSFSWSGTSCAFECYTRAECCRNEKP